MPFTTQHDGKEVTAFTQAELDAAVEAAKANLMTPEQAEQLANSKAAAARKDAEKKLTDLQTELAAAQGNTAKVAELEKQITEQAAKLTGGQRLLDGIKAMAGAGMTVAQAEFLMAHPAFAAAEFDTAEKVSALVEQAKGLGFGVTPPATNGKPNQQQQQQKPPANGSTGTPSEKGGTTTQATSLRDAIREKFEGGA